MQVVRYGKMFDNITESLALFLCGIEVDAVPKCVEVVAFGCGGVVDLVEFLVDGE